MQIKFIGAVWRPKCRKSVPIIYFLGPAFAVLPSMSFSGETLVNGRSAANYSAIAGFLLPGYTGDQGFSGVGGKAQKSPHSGKLAFLVNQQPEEVIDEAYHTGSQ
mgnify:CR=1 FL=1